MSLLRRLRRDMSVTKAVRLEAAEGGPAEEAFEAAEKDKSRKLLFSQVSMSVVAGLVFVWTKDNCLDIFTVGGMGIACLLFNKLSHPAHRLFEVPMTQDDATLSPHATLSPYAYPRKPFIIPIWLSTLLPIVVPTIIFLIAQRRVRSFWDLNNAVAGLLYSLITSTFIQVFLKGIVAGLRPHFLAACRPILPQPPEGQGYQKNLWSREVCTGDKKAISFAMSSFPSGHTTAAFAGFVYLSLYLNAKFKICANHHAQYWKFALVHLPVFGAILVGSSVIADNNHHWYDVLAGAALGTYTAFAAYRAVWASVWDFRFNHIPLMENIPFTYDALNPGYVTFGKNTVVRKAGWGIEGQQFGGAPFDALSGLKVPALPVPGVPHMPGIPNIPEAYSVSGIPGVPSVVPKPSSPIPPTPSPIIPNNRRATAAPFIGAPGPRVPSSNSPILHTTLDDGTIEGSAGFGSDDVAKRAGADSGPRSAGERAPQALPKPREGPQKH